MILECSSKGDRRFSAFYAQVEVYGVKESIENHYQGCKRTKEGGLVNKGKKVDHIFINGHTLPAKWLTCWYQALWIKYLDNHPELVAYAKQYDDFNDMFRGHCINCQADVIRQYIKKGRKSFFTEDFKTFLNMIK